ncbi:MAG: DUF3604 domain-containing protein [Proteobacteria bacterium]|nr:DUF3604 domain-containing protein [Pseudomonadota bacterium]
MRRLSRLCPLLLLLAACSDDSPADSSTTAQIAESSTPITNISMASGSEYNDNRNAYFGDLHVHTMYSFDAFIFGTTSSPDDAYRFAKGGTIKHPAGFDMKLDVPLDFYGVSDHAFYLGVLREMANPDTEISKHEIAAGMTTLGDATDRRQVFNRILQFLGSPRSSEINDPQIAKTAWDDIVATANRHNDPGKFTAFIAYEYTTTDNDRGNLHRNVIFRGGVAPELPFSRLDSQNPEDLWQWMDANRAAGIESLASPHNSNGSNGSMFMLTDWSGRPLDSAYATQRMRNEPLVEITQVKGTSDTHPALSPNDEWAEFEIMPYRIATRLDSKAEGSYVREAYLNGLEMQANLGFNPYKFGVIGSSDTHNATYAGDEDNFWSKVGLLDDEPVKRGSVPLPAPREDGGVYADTYFQYWGAAGLAGVWAEENTRDAIYNAFRRKETFGTSGPRIKVRFFAGYELPLIDDRNLLSMAYETGVPMGGDLIAKKDKELKFLVWAARDANSAPLQRLQVIKASVRDGISVERVFDVACSDGAEVDSKTHRCPDNGARVNLETCGITDGVGAAELRTIWQDPDYNPSERAMYYVRVLENPTCRWSTWDAIRAGVEPREDLHATIQERAWSSPIWVSPSQD